MTYLDYHNKNADTYAQRMFDRDYAHITHIAQMMVDDRMAVDYMDTYHAQK